MTDQELDRLMRRVLLDSLRNDEAIGMTVTFAPSRKHQHQMSVMLKDPLKWLRNRMKPIWKLAAQRAAVILLAASVSLGSLMAVSPTVRAAVVRWATEWYETYVVYRYSGEDILNVMPEYKILELPDGFFENPDNRIENPGYVGIWYENSEGEVILFDYMYIQQGAASGFVADGSAVLNVTVNGFEGQLFKSTTPQTSDSTLTWIDPEANIQFTVDAMLDETEMLHIAESVILVDSTK